jgi:hypothetical protein
MSAVYYLAGSQSPCRKAPSPVEISPKSTKKCWVNQATVRETKRRLPNRTRGVVSLRRITLQSEWAPTPTPRRPSTIWRSAVCLAESLAGRRPLFYNLDRYWSGLCRLQRHPQLKQGIQLTLRFFESLYLQSWQNHAIVFEVYVPSYMKSMPTSTTRWNSSNQSPISSVWPVRNNSEFGYSFAMFRDFLLWNFMVNIWIL